MTTSLDDQLAAYGETLDRAVREHLRPATAAEAAGEPSADRSRALRRLALLAAAFAALLAGGLVIVSAGSPSPAWADWTPLARPAPAAEVDELDTFCRGATPAGELDVLIVDIRGSGAAAIYGDDTRWVTCHAERASDGAFRLASTSTHVGGDLSAARAVIGPEASIATISVGWRGDPPASLIWGVAGAQVARIEISTVDGVVETAMSGDVWVAWWPSDDAATATVRADDASGSVLVEGTAGELAPALPSPSTIAADVELEGTALERSIVADGIVTWPEFVTALEAWRACVADDGYDLTIEIDDDAQTYVAISPIVEVEAPQGEPDDAAAEKLLAPIGSSIETCRAVHVRRLEQLLVQQ